MDGTLTAYMPKPPPIILGHEVAGVVVAVGSDVTDYRVGDRALVSTSHHAVIVAGKLRAGQRIGIVGLGGLGMTGARIAVLKGAEVYAAEPRREVR